MEISTKRCIGSCEGKSGKDMLVAMDTKVEKFGEIEDRQRIKTRVLNEVH